MGGHDHGHEQPYKIPDYRIYKVEDAPKLVATRDALSAHGLKNPWLRNEVWRYNAKEFGTEKSRFRAFFFRGFKYGFGAFVLTIAAGELYKLANPSSHEHGHGEGHH